MAVDTKALEANLTGEFSKAQERLQSAKTAIGIADAPQHETFGFAPRAIKIKGKMIAEAELADLNQQHGFVIEDFIRASKMVDSQQQARANIEMKKDFAKTRDAIVRAGLKLDQTLSDAKISAETHNAIIGVLAKGVAAAAKGYTIHKLSGMKKPIDDRVPGMPKGMSPGPVESWGRGMHGQTHQDWATQQQYDLDQSIDQMNIPSTGML